MDDVRHAAELQQEISEQQRAGELAEAARQAAYRTKQELVEALVQQEALCLGRGRGRGRWA